MFTIHDGHAVNTVDAPVNLKSSAFIFAASNDSVESYIRRIPLHRNISLPFLIQQPLHLEAMQRDRKIVVHIFTNMAIKFTWIMNSDNVFLLQRRFTHNFR